jgi:hypothetical protein
MQHGCSMDAAWMQHGCSMDAAWMQHGCSMEGQRAGAKVHALVWLRVVLNPSESANRGHRYSCRTKALRKLTVIFHCGLNILTYITRYLKVQLCPLYLLTSGKYLHGIASRHNCHFSTTYWVLEPIYHASTSTLIHSIQLTSRSCPHYHLQVPNQTPS